MAPLITLLTDFGTSDSYVAEVKAVLLSRALGAALAHHRPVPRPAPRALFRRDRGAGRSDLRRSFRHADLEHPGRAGGARGADQGRGNGGGGAASYVRRRGARPARRVRGE